MKESVTRWVGRFKLGGRFGVAAASNFRSSINQVDGKISRYFTSLSGLPALKISAKDKEFPADLDYPDALFLNDSAEMPHREACQLGCVRNVQKRPFYCTSIGRFHIFLLL